MKMGFSWFQAYSTTVLLMLEGRVNSCPMAQVVWVLSCCTYMKVLMVRSWWKQRLAAIDGLLERVSRVVQWLDMLTSGKIDGNSGR